jgi:hypothetical protein
MATYRYPLNVESSPLRSDAMGRGVLTDYLIIYVLNTSNPSEGFNPFANIGRGNRRVSDFFGEGQQESVIYLQMPNQIQANYSIEYADVDMGALGQAAVNLISGDDNAAEVLRGMADSMKPELKANLAASALGTANSALGLGGGVTGGDLSVLAKRKAFNPYKENVFRSVSFREHSFNIKMVPRNARESQEIKKIVNVLKYAMHPSFSGSGASSQRWLDIPYSFGLEYKRDRGGGGAQILHRFKPCVLKNLSVDYTPDGNYVSGRDLTTASDHGLAVNVQMTFKETQILTKADFQSFESVQF